MRSFVKCSFDVTCLPFFISSYLTDTEQKSWHVFETDFSEVAVHVRAACRQALRSKPLRLQLC